MRSFGSVLCMTVFALGVGACSGAGDEPAERNGAFDDAGRTVAAEEAGPIGSSGIAEGLVSVADIAANPSEYAGQTVTVEADLEEVFGPRAFALDEDAFVRGGIDNDMLVLGTSTQGLEAIDDQWLNNKVRVTGTFVPTAVVEVEREVGWDLDPEIEVELERSGAVLIASSVQRASPDAGAGASTLPDTASPLALTGFIALLSLGSAFGLHAVRRDR